ncbi:hypothetical protein Daus18300_010522 [Diaporthe australafricana]|uniref:Peroxidase n=1 Tax=Diaporthe australafricana TaxID=127596 RepID=A0ABR3WA47_9PEZI
MLFGRALGNILPGLDYQDVYEEMEHFLVEDQSTGKIGRDFFVRAVTPCSNYISVGSSENLTIQGEQSSAQWIRVAFHDFITANISAGTGGLDASIGFEAYRDENVGLAINDTLNFFNPTVTAYLSMADNIALGVIAAVSTCGTTTTTPNIPLRFGRVDADVAGPSGVPGPDTDLDETFKRFDKAGFNQSDAIALTVDGGQPFDSTPTIFDTTVVNEYLDGTGQMGGPLITTSDVGNRSDLRLYTSDANATMHSLSTLSAFLPRCYSLFERMINTVPADVSLSEPVLPMMWKVENIYFDIDASGSPSVAGNIRYLHSPDEVPEHASYNITSAGGEPIVKTTGIVNATGYGLFGNMTFWHINETLSTPGSSVLSVTDVSYPLKDGILVLSPQSTWNQTLDYLSPVVIRAAAKTTLVAGTEQVTAQFWYPMQDETNSRQFQRATTNISLSEYGTAGDYTLYEGSFVLPITDSHPVAKIFIGDVSSRAVNVKSSFTVPS